MDLRIINNNGRGNNIFPRDLTELEKDFLFSVLPENKTGYKIYRDKINELKVTGAGRFGGGNYILGNEGSVPDNSFPSAPVLASGTIEFDECISDINIHEELDNEIEFDISFSKEKIPAVLHEKNRWSYSVWIPGQKAPSDNSEVREIKIPDKRYLLAIAPVHKRIWFHDSITGINHLIPVSNLYNYIMLMKSIRNADIVSKPLIFFRDHKNYNDFEIASAFLLYNKYFKKFNIDYKDFESEPAKPKKKSIFKIFKRG